jgi:hypothetical protein
VRLLASGEKDDSAHNFSARLSLEADPEVVAIAHQEAVLAYGNSGHATPRCVGTDASGFLWFFGPSTSS